MKNNTPISIIMPCLNSAGYICEAMDSILAQTYAAIELIVVDGGSVDGTLEVLKSRSACDARIRVLHSEKKSMGAQYNLGLDSVQGEFIGFVESDDFIAPDMYEVLYESISGSDLDYVKSNFDMFIDLPDQRLFYAHGPIAEHQHDYYGTILSPEYLCELARRDIFIWNGLYKRSFISENNMRFQETPGAAFQDAGFVSQVLMSAKRVLYIKNSLYRYRKGNSEASSSSAKTYRFVMDEFAYVIGKLNPQTKDLFLPAFLRRYFGSFHNCLRQYLRHYGYTDELAEQVRPFKKLFLEHYNALPFPQLSRSDLWPPQDFALFAKDFEEYCMVSLTRYESDCAAHLRAAKYLAEQESLVICGTGENAASVHCYLTRCGLRNVKAFCSDIKEGSYYGKELLSADQAAMRYPNATFVVTQGAGRQDKMKRQLLDLGVDPERIIYYGEGLFHHNWYELPTIMSGLIGDL